MRLRPEQLTRHLEQTLSPVYLVSGDEPLQVQECSDRIRRSARDQGCTDRTVLDAAPASFDWQELLLCATSMSLFTERKLVELRLPGGKPGKEGSKALCRYLELAGSEDVLLIVAGKIDRQSTSSKWFKALDAAGVVLQLWPIGARELPRWLQQRVESAGMRIDKQALQLLCERVEGNLLAAVQEIEKLKLLAADGTISAQTVTASVADNARYNLFDMVDHALRGDRRSSLRTLHGLRGEGTEPAVVLWVLVRELRTLGQLREDCDRGQPPQQAMAARRVWKNRVPLVQAALSRHDRASLQGLLEQATAADGSIKGYGPGRAWDQLESLLIRL